MRMYVYIYVVFHINILIILVLAVSTAVYSASSSCYRLCYCRRQAVWTRACYCLASNLNIVNRKLQAIGTFHCAYVLPQSFTYWLRFIITCLWQLQTLSWLAGFAIILCPAHIRLVIPCEHLPCGRLIDFVSILSLWFFVFLLIKWANQWAHIMSSHLMEQQSV